MYSISDLGKKFNLSRSALLYYDSIGILKASNRTHSNYRSYSEAEAERLKQICGYRQVGLSLKEIQQILKGSANRAINLLEQRLESLNREIQSLREQQHIIIKILKKKSLRQKSRAIDKAAWINILRATGLDEDGMRKWHIEFERANPEAHQDFLESIRIPRLEIQKIRTWSHAGAKAV